MVTNEEFLKALFSENYHWVHVTDFSYDPSNVPKEHHLKAWAGNYFSRYRFGENTNQYFTISNFYADENEKARRRKSLFWQTPVIVLDDVKEKLSLEEVNKLPSPTWILETSPGSEQWGYLLTEPCTNRSKVENLLDGLVANGLAPDGKDPGMRGVTRYVRLPGGYNSKASKLVDGKPFKCRMTHWFPFARVTMEQLAAPFNVDLEATRREGRIDGASAISDHPLINIPDIIEIKEVRSNGRFDIVCPWVDEHTGKDDSGSAIFTNGDGTIGFKCHHGSCQDRTGADLLRYIESKRPNFNSNLKTWQSNRQFQSIFSNIGGGTKADTTGSNGSGSRSDNAEQYSKTTRAPVVIDAVRTGDNRDQNRPGIGQAVYEEPQGIEAAQIALNALQQELPGSMSRRRMAGEVLKAVDALNAIDRVHWHKEIRDIMHWNEREFSSILNALRGEWYSEAKDEDFLKDMFYVSELDKFYDRYKRIFFTPQAFQNAFSHIDTDARNNALRGEIKKVDKLDYAPGEDEVFTYRGITHVNSWHQRDVNTGVEGDVSKWLEHWDRLGWSNHQKHMLQWMAWTIKHPEVKINHILLLGGQEGIGKDFLLYPLTVAMEGNQVTIDGDALTDNFNEYLLSTKYLHINEIEVSDHREAEQVGKRIKPLAAAPPEKISVNTKGVSRIQIRNVVNASAGTNSTLPFKTKELSRRIYGMWSDLNTRDASGQVTPYWRDYWIDTWGWMKDANGVDACIYYLRNCVDLSDFNPSLAPEMTAFVKHIFESSKSPLTQTIETLIRRHFNSFRVDLLTTVEITEAIKNSETFTKNAVYVESRFLTPMKVLNAMMSMSNMRSRNVIDANHDVKVWIIRDPARYCDMSDEDFLKEYHNQCNVNKNANGGIKVIK